MPGDECDHIKHSEPDAATPILFLASEAFIRSGYPRDIGLLRAMERANFAHAPLETSDLHRVNNAKLF